MSKWQTWLCEKCGVSHAMNETKCFHCSHPKPTTPPGEQQGFPPKAMYFRQKMYRGFFDGMEEVEAGERGAIKYVPEALLSEAVREAASTIERLRSDNQRLVNIVDGYKTWGTDGCTTCETGRITLFVWNKQCLKCNPKSYEAASTEGGKGGGT